MNYITPNNKYEVFVKNISIKQKFDKPITKSVNITPRQIQECIEYARESVENSNDYIELVPNDIKDINIQKEVGMQRIFIEKIAECGVVNFLIHNNIDKSVLSKYKIGIKTAIAKEIHTRLIIEKKNLKIRKIVRIII